MLGLLSQVFSLYQSLKRCQNLAGDGGSVKVGWMRKAHSWAVSDWGLAISMGFPGGSDGKESTCNMGDLGSIPGLGRSPGGGHGNTLQYSCLENPHEQRSLAGYGPRGCKESDMPEQLSTAQHICIYIKTTLTYSWMKATVIKHYKWPKKGGGQEKKAYAGTQWASNSISWRAELIS